MLGGSGVAGHLALILLSFAVVYTLGQGLDLMPLSLAFFLVGVLWAVVAGVLAMLGKQEMKKVEKPERTIRTVKEDVEWAKNRPN